MVGCFVCYAVVVACVNAVPFVSEKLSSSEKKSSHLCFRLGKKTLTVSRLSEKCRYFFKFTLSRKILLERNTAEVMDVYGGSPEVGAEEKFLLEEKFYLG